MARSATADLSNRPFLTQDSCSLTRAQAVRHVSPMYECSQSPHLRRCTALGSSSRLVRSFGCCLALISNYSYFQRPRDSLQVLDYSFREMVRGLLFVGDGWSSTSPSRDRTDSSVFHCLIRVSRLSIKRAGQSLASSSCLIFENSACFSSWLVTIPSARPKRASNVLCLAVTGW